MIFPTPTLEDEKGADMRQKMLLAAAMSATLVLSGCLGQQQESSGDQDTNRNADAKKVELTIGSNSVKGGKNSAGATLIAGLW